MKKDVHSSGMNVFHSWRNERYCMSTEVLLTLESIWRVRIPLKRLNLFEVRALVKRKMVVENNCHVEIIQRNKSTQLKRKCIFLQVNTYLSLLLHQLSSGSLKRNSNDGDQIVECYGRITEKALRSQSSLMPLCSTVLLLIGSRFELIDWVIICYSFI